MSKELVEANCGMSGYFIAGKEIPENAFNTKIHSGSIKDEMGYSMSLWNGINCTMTIELLKKWHSTN
jgi:hypothetical protein